MTEAEYCQAVAIGRISVALKALADAHSLLDAIKHPNASALQNAYASADKTLNFLYSEIKFAEAESSDESSADR